MDRPRCDGTALSRTITDHMDMSPDCCALLVFHAASLVGKAAAQEGDWAQLL